MSQNHVYEIRFLSEAEGIRRNCRVLFTLNESKVYLVWTHGFTKIPTEDKQKIIKMNELTNQLARLAELIHNSLIINNEDAFIGKAGERCEIR